MNKSDLVILFYTPANDLFNNSSSKALYENLTKPRFYLNEEDLERCIDEDYGIALSMSSKRKSLVEIESDNIMKFNAISYRYPICQKYGNCTFSSFCLANSPPPVINLDKEDRIKWTTKMESTQVDDLPF